MFITYRGPVRCSRPSGAPLLRCPRTPSLGRGKAAPGSPTLGRRRMPLARCACLAPWFSSGEDVLQPFEGRLAADLADGVGQRDLLGADLDAVLRVAAGGHAARAHERVETVGLVGLAGGVEVHEERLAEGGGADETGARRVVAVDLGANFEAASAGDT